MNKTFLLISIIFALTGILSATIFTDPASGIAYVGDVIIFTDDCNDSLCSNFYYWGDGTGDNAASTLYMPKFYRNPGNYMVHVHRDCSYCLSDEYKSVTILENRFLTVSSSQISPGQPVTFTASNFNKPNNISWNMDDGTVYMGRGTTITHTFAKAGTYKVRAFDWDGDTTTKPVSLSIKVSEPIRMIHYTPAMPRVDQPVDMQAVNFKLSSIDWNFGDGTPPQTYSTMVSHRYQNPGTFTITAKESGISVASESQSITILPENRSLALSVLEARTDEPVTVTAVNFRGPLVLWDFGDGSITSGPGTVASYSRPVGISGPATMTHAYKLPGNYTITARDENGVSEKRFQAAVRVIGISDQVHLEIAEITLDNGKYYKVIPKNSKNIKAQLKMKMKGTGIVSGYWIVDNQPYQFFNETAYQGQIKTILTSEVPGLPVFDPGMHTITVQLTRPRTNRLFSRPCATSSCPTRTRSPSLPPRTGRSSARTRWRRSPGRRPWEARYTRSPSPTASSRSCATRRASAGSTARSACATRPTRKPGPPSGATTGPTGRSGPWTAAAPSWQSATSGK